MKTRLGNQNTKTKYVPSRRGTTGIKPSSARVVGHFLKPRLLKRHSGTLATQSNLRCRDCALDPIAEWGCTLGFYAGMVADQIGVGFRVKACAWNRAEDDDTFSLRCGSNMSSLCMSYLKSN